MVGDPAARDAAPRKGVEKGTENVSRDHVVADERDGARDRDRRKVDHVSVDGGARRRRRRAGRGEGGRVRRGASRAVRHGRRRRAGRARPPRRPGADHPDGERSRRPRGSTRTLSRDEKERREEARRARGRRSTTRTSSNTWSARTATARVASWTWRVQTTRSRSGWRRRTRRSSPRWCTRRGRSTVWRPRLLSAQVAPRVPWTPPPPKRRASVNAALARTRMGLVQGGEGAAGDEGVPTYVSVLTRVPTPKSTTSVGTS